MVLIKSTSYFISDRFITFQQINQLLFFFFLNKRHYALISPRWYICYVIILSCIHNNM